MKRFTESSENHPSSAFRAILFLLLALSPAPASAEPPIHVAYEKTVLPNGLTLILHEDHRLPLVAIDMLYRVGSSQERPGRSGFAHLFEHLMFTGSEHVPNGLFDRLLEAAGGENNATTETEATDYYELLPSNALELPLYLDADRMATLGRAITKEKFETQRSVVENERREDVDNRPYGRTEETMLASLFPEGHPYHLPVIGTVKDLDAATLDDVKQFFAEFYVPNDAILSIAGDLDPKRTEALVRKYFGAIPRGPVSAPLRPAPVEVPREIRLRLEDRVELPRLTIAWVTPADFQPGDAALDVLARVLTGDKTSRLYRRLVYDRQIAQDVSSNQESRSLASIFTISVTARPGHSLGEIEKVVDQELVLLQAEAPSAEELERARAVIAASFVRRLEKIGGFGGLADQLAIYESAVGEPDYFQRDLDRYRSLAPDDLRSAAGLLSRGHRVILSVVPPGKTDLAAPAESAAISNVPSPAPTSAVDWASIPAPGPPSDVRLPAVHRSKLANGLSVWIVEQHSLPIVRTDLIVPRGSSDDPPGLPGLARMTTAMLTRGTQFRSALEISGQASLLGAELGAGAGWDSSFVSLDVPAGRWSDALDLFSDIALHPGFQSSELDRIRKEAKTSVQEELAEPEAIAEKAFDRTIFGSRHPYGRSPEGALGSLDRIQPANVRDAYRTSFQPGRAVLVVVGDVKTEDALARIERRFGAWKGTGPAPSPVPASGPSKPKIILIDKPGAAQSEVRVGKVGVPRSTPDDFAIQVMNTILGGPFTSRLNQNLREAHGYAYGAFSGFSMRRGAGPFVAEAAIQTDSTGPALAEMFAELKRIVSEKPSDAELRKAKNYLALSFPETMETAGDLARSLASLFVYNLSEDYYDRYVNNVEAVSADDVLRAARATLGGDFAVVIVGDVSKIRPEIEKLKLGPIELAKYDPNTGDVVPAKPRT